MKKLASPDQLAKRTTLSPDQFERVKGTKAAHEFKKEEDGKFKKSVPLIRGVFKAWLKSPKFVLLLDAQVVDRQYLTKQGSLTTSIKEAVKFAYGFDEPEVKVKYWNQKTGLTFKEFRYGKTKKQD